MRKRVCFDTCAGLCCDSEKQWVKNGFQLSDRHLLFMLAYKHQGGFCVAPKGFIRNVLEDITCKMTSGINYSTSDSRFCFKAQRPQKLGPFQVSLRRKEETRHVWCCLALYIYALLIAIVCKGQI